MKLEELCHCGGKLAVETTDERGAVEILKGWRDGHRCGRSQQPAGNGSSAQLGFAGRDPHRRIEVK